MSQLDFPPGTIVLLKILVIQNTPLETFLNDRCKKIKAWGNLPGFYPSVYIEVAIKRSFYTLSLGPDLPAVIQPASNGTLDSFSFPLIFGKQYSFVRFPDKQWIITPFSF